MNFHEQASGSIISLNVKLVYAEEKPRISAGLQMGRYGLLFVQPDASRIENRHVRWVRHFASKKVGW